MMKKYASVDAYLKDFPVPVRKSLSAIRDTIRKAAPGAEEGISYGIPAYKQYGGIACFGGYTGHIGFYPGAEAIATFKKDLASFETSKGTVRFPLDRPLPRALVTRMVRFRVKENLRAAKLKGKA